MKLLRTALPPPTDRSASRWRRPLAAAAALTTAAALSVLWAPAASAAGDECGDVGADRFIADFNAGGVIDLAEYIEGTSLSITCSLTVEGNTTLNLGGKTLAVTGTTGDDANNGAAGITVNGTLTINGGGVLNVTGGTGGSGSEGAPGVPGAGATGGQVDGGDGGDGGVGGAGAKGGYGLAGDGTILVQNATLNAFGGKGGTGGEGGRGGVGGRGQSGTDGFGGDGGDGGKGGDGGVGGDAVGGTLFFALVNGNLSATVGAGGDGGSQGIAGPGGLPGTTDYEDYRGGQSGAGGGVGNEGSPGSKKVLDSVTVAIADLGEPDGAIGSDVPDEAPWTVLNGNANRKGFDGGIASSFTAFGTGTIADAITRLKNDVGWPLKTAHTFVGWFTGANYGDPEITSDLEIGDFAVVYGGWMTGGDDDNDDDDGNENENENGGGGEGSGGGDAPVTTPVTPPATTPVTTPETTPVTTVPDAPISPTPATTPASVSTTPVPQPLPGTDSADLGVNNHTPAQGGNIVLTAQGFKPGTNVDFWINSTPVYLGSAVADAFGIARLPVTLDVAYTGEHHVQAIGVGPQGQPRNLQQAITIDAPPALASTGVPTWSFVLIALELLAAGVALLRLQQRGSRATRNHA